MQGFDGVTRRGKRRPGWPRCWW